MRNDRALTNCCDLGSVCPLESGTIGVQMWVRLALFGLAAPVASDNAHSLSDVR